MASDFWYQASALSEIPSLLGDYPQLVDRRSSPPGRTATGLAAILGGMQNAAAQRASSPPRSNRDVLIKDEKQLMECGVGQQG